MGAHSRPPPGLLPPGLLPPPRLPPEARIRGVDTYSSRTCGSRDVCFLAKIHFGILRLPRVAQEEKLLRILLLLLLLLLLDVKGEGNEDVFGECMSLG